MEQPSETETVETPRIPSRASKPSQTLGKWIDNLLGDKRARDKAAVKALRRERAMEVSSHGRSRVIEG
jgi:hypothetical protein